MPDRFIVYATNCGYRSHRDATWANAIAHGGVPSFGSPLNNVGNVVGEAFLSPDYEINQLVYLFNLSPISTGSLSFRVVITNNGTMLAGVHGKKIEFREHSWSPATFSASNMVPGGSLGSLPLLATLTLDNTLAKQTSSASVTTDRTASYGMLVHTENARIGVAPTDNTGRFYSLGSATATQTQRPHLNAVLGEMVIFTTSGATQSFAQSQTWTVPANVSSITVEGWGCGATASGGITGKAPGGGGGGYAKTTIAVVPGDIIYYQVAPASSPSDYSFTSLSPTPSAIPTWASKNVDNISSAFMRAASGHYGSTTSEGLGGGGSPVANPNIGDVTFTGGLGPAPQGGGGSRGSSGGGASASSTANGAPGVAGSGSSGGAGGVATGDGGSGGNGSAAGGGAGGSGVVPGGGGGGGGMTGGTHGNGARGEIIITYSVDDTTAPVITSSNTVAVSENANLSHGLTADESVTWAITGGADAAWFEISGSTLRWLNNGTKDFEFPDDADLNNTYVVQIRARDTSNNDSYQTVTVTVTDVVEGGEDITPPTITSASTVNVAENATLSHALTADEAVNWGIVAGADSAKFEIAGSTLRWLNNGTKDFEAPDDQDSNNTYVVQVVAQDTSFNESYQVITVTVTDVAEGGGDTTPPTITSPDSLSVQENASFIHALTANEEVTWAIRTTAENAASLDPTQFSLDGASLTWNGAPVRDFESPQDSNLDNVYVVIIRATDLAGNFTDQTFSVTVTDVTETEAGLPTAVVVSSANLNDATVSVLADIDTLFATATAVGDASEVRVGFNTPAATLQTGANLQSITVEARKQGGANTPSFVIEIYETGGITPLASSASIDVTGGGQFDFTWDAAILSNLSGADVEVRVLTTPTTNGPAKNHASIDYGYIGWSPAVVVDTTPPSITSLDTVSLAENTPLSHALTADEPVTWSITGGDDAAFFRLNGAGDQLLWAAGFTPDYENPQDANSNNTYWVTIRATDGTGNFSNQTITVTITDVVETAGAFVTLLTSGFT
jgi:hypothetical protein